MKAQVALIYVNGLGNGKLGRSEHFMRRHWQRSDVAFYPAGINWYDGQPIANKIEQLLDTIDVLVKKYEKVILFGSSAGGSLALNCFVQRTGPQLYFVNARGRLRRGDLHRPDYRSLQWAAHLNSTHSSQSFYDSVELCEGQSLPALKHSDLQRILVLKPIVDFVVPLSTMTVPGATTRRMFAFGHKWSGYTSIITSRDCIRAFAD